MKTLELACNIGDSVYFTKTHFSELAVPKKEKVHRITISEWGTQYRSDTRCFDGEAIGTKVFLSEEAAWEAIRKRDKG